MPKGRKLLIISFLLVCLLAAGIFFYFKQRAQSPAVKVHYHAAFLVYQDNQPLDFSALKYMKIENCTVNNVQQEDEQLEKAHLHDNIGNIVHIQQANATWKDLFFNIRFEMTKDVVGYINGQLVPDILNQKIEPHDRVLFLIGINDNLQEKLAAVPDDAQITKIDNSSESCGSSN